MLDVAFGIIFIACSFILFGDWVYRRIPLEEVSAGTKIYIKSKRYQKTVSKVFEYIKHRNVLVVWALERGPRWNERDYLFVNRLPKRYKKGNYYLLAEGDWYRIAKCIDYTAGLSPVFDHNENLSTHKCLGEVFCVMHDDKMNYSIRTEYLNETFNDYLPSQY